MRYFYGALLLVLFSPFCATGQTNFQSGFVVTSAGDTLQGHINVREWTQNPSSIFFKKAETDLEQQEFIPATSRFFGVPGQVAYQSYRGRISMDPNDFSKLLTWADTTRATVSAFLRVVQSGRHVRLLAYQDEVKIRFFLQQAEGQPQELGFRAYLDQQENRVRSVKFYTGQLLLAAQKFGTDTPALKNQLASAAYREQDLQAVVARINGLDDHQVKVLQNNRTTRLLVGLGLSRSVFQVSGNHELAQNSTYGASYRPRLSIGADLFNNPEVQRSFLRGQLSLSESVADIRMEKDGTIVREGLLTFKQRTLAFSGQGAYNFYNGSTCQVNLGVGGSLNLSAYANESFRTRSYTRMDGSIASGSNTKDEFKYQRVWFSIPIRAGLIIDRKWDFSFVYFFPTVVGKSMGDMSYTGLHLEVNYLFRKSAADRP